MGIFTNKTLRNELFKHEPLFRLISKQFDIVDGIYFNFKLYNNEMLLFNKLKNKYAIYFIDKKEYRIMDSDDFNMLSLVRNMDSDDFNMLSILRNFEV